MDISQKLVLSLQAYQKASSKPQQTQACDQVIRLIRRLPYVYKNGDRRYHPQDFEEAFQLVYLSLFKGGLEHFLDYLQTQGITLSASNALEIQQSFVGLVNRICKRRNLDIQRKKKAVFSLDMALGDDGFALVDIYVDEQQTDPIETIWQEQCQTQIQDLANSADLRAIHVKSNPAANLGVILMARYHGENWQAIATLTQTPYGSITALFHRQKPYLRKLLQEAWDSQTCH